MDIIKSVQQGRHLASRWAFGTWSAVLNKGRRCRI